MTLLRAQWDLFKEGDILLGDKGVCSYYDVAQGHARGVDSVISLARRRPLTEVQASAVLGPDDLLIRWYKPKGNTRLSYDQEQSRALPDSLLLRQIKVTVKDPGFRTTSFHLITTLTDPSTYPADDLADLYYQRWDVELFLRDIKTTLGMDIVRGHSADQVHKEILMHFIVCNSLRWLMQRAAQLRGTPVRRISFKASLQALRHWEPQCNQPRTPAEPIIGATT